MPDKEKIFISWSGNRSREVALKMRDLVQLVSDNIDPFVSEADIELGARPMDTIAEKLSECRIAIIIVTPENYDKPWLNFEAGAISSQIDDPKTRVIPMLVGMSVPLPAGPLAQFQAHELSSTGLDKLFAQLAVSVSAIPEVFQKRLDLDKASFLDAVTKLMPDDTTKRAPQVDVDDMVREILQSTRDLSMMQRELLEQIWSMTERTMAQSVLVERPPRDLSNSDRLRFANEFVSDAITRFAQHDAEGFASLQLRLEFDERKVKVVTGRRLPRSMQDGLTRIVNEEDPYHRDVSFIMREVDPGLPRRRQGKLERRLVATDDNAIDPDSL